MCSPLSITVTILQIHLNVPLELVILRENRNHRHLSSRSWINLCYTTSYWPTILIRADIFEMLQIELWSLVIHRDAVPSIMTISNYNYKHSKLRTISHVIYLPVAFLQTSLAQSSAQSSIPLRLPTQIRGNHETRNRHDWRKRSRPQSCVRHAGTNISSNQRMLPYHQPLWMGPVWSGQEVNPNLQSNKALTTYLLSPPARTPVNNWTFGSVADSL